MTDFKLDKLHSDLRSSRLSHARLALQHLTASLVAVRRRYFLDATLDVNTALPEDLSFWSAFTSGIMDPFNDFWWEGISTDLRKTVHDSLSAALLHSPILCRVSGDGLPPLPPGAFHAEVFVDCLWEMFCSIRQFGRAKALYGRLTGWASEDRRFFLNAQPDPSLLMQCVTVSLPEGSAQVWWQGETLLAIRAANPLAARPVASHRRSNFLDRSIAWPWWELGIPQFHSTALPLRAAVWREVLSPFLGAAAESILAQGFVIPRSVGLGLLSHHDNHPTVDNDPALIDRIVAKYIITGIAEVIPPDHPPPAATHALGLVPKKSEDEPWRLIHDCRPDNRSVIDWPSRLHGVAASHYLFSRRAWVFTLDLKAAYYTIPLRGCGGGLRPTGFRLPSGFPEFVMGCSTRDGTCRGGCDKDRLGFVWKGRLRMNCSPFGGKVSGNALKVLTDAWGRKWRRKGVRLIIWVDDLCIIVPNPHNKPAGRWYDARAPAADRSDIFVDCEGPAACATCLASYKTACALRDEIVHELGRLGWLTNEKDSGPPAMQGDFIGIHFDTSRDAFVVVEDKVIKLIKRVSKLLAAAKFSRRKLAKLRGKLGWFSCCLQYVDVMTRAMSAWVGSPESASGWDVDAAPDDGVRFELTFWKAELPRLALRARPITRLPPSFFYEHWLSDAPLSMPNTPLGRFLDVAGVVFVDASVHGYAWAWYDRPAARPILRVFPVPEGVRWEEQVHREAFAFRQATEFATERAAGRAVVLISDCRPVVQAATRGSPSAVLQEVARAVATLSLLRDVAITPMWVPGEEMVRLGVDGLSRGGSASLHEVSLRQPFLQQVLSGATAYLGGESTVDWFASARSAVCTRFWSRYGDEGAEGIDAMLCPSWAASVCRCGQTHREKGFFFPPVPLLGDVWAKIKLDGAEGVVVVPVTPGAPWWPLLEESCIFRLDLGRACDVLTAPHPSLSVYRGEQQWAAVVFRFTPPASDLPAPQACTLFRTAPLPSPVLDHVAAGMSTLRSYLHDAWASEMDMGAVGHRDD